MRPPWMARVLKMQEHFSASRQAFDADQSRAELAST